MAWRNIAVRFGAVAVAVGLDPATERDAAPSAHRYDSATRTRVKQAWTSDGETLSPETFLAYETESGELVEAERVADDCPRDFTIAASIAPLDPVMLDGDYLVSVGKDSGEGVALLARSLSDSGEWLAGTVRLTDRKRSAVLRYSHVLGALVLSTLRYAEAIRTEKAASYGAAYGEPSALVREQGSALFAMLRSESFEPLAVDNVAARLRAAIAAPEGEPEGTTADEDPVTTGDALLAAMRETLSEGIVRRSGGKAKLAKGESTKSKSKSAA